MLDFLIISTRSTKRGVVEVYPRFKICKSSDLMIRAGDFYAIWDEDRGLWSTSEEDVIRLIDNELDEYVRTHKDSIEDHISVLYMWDADSGSIDRWHKYCQKQLRDNYHPLDENLIFANDATIKENYASKKLPYALENGDISAWQELTKPLYLPEELHKIEWAIGAIVTGASKQIQKFLVFYGPPGSGKSTIIEIIQKLFDGYYCIFDSKALGSGSPFALEPFHANPVVAIEHDGDLSKIEDNTRLNSVVSHEKLPVNEKHKSIYTMKFISFLIMGTNKYVKITDSKSGILRRLIDVRPTGKKLSFTKYNSLMKQIEFELGHIAAHCRDVYLEDPTYYKDYVPTMMMSESNDFYNYILDTFNVFKQNDGITLKQAYELYKIYCEDSKVAHPMPKRLFKSELMNYFEKYDERVNVDGEWVRSYFSGFKTDILKTGKIVNEVKEEKKDDSYIIDFKEQESILDKCCENCFAQYANEKETPVKKWSEVVTKLKDIDTRKLHYLKVPEKLIVIDFDIKGPDGKKSFELNLKAASLFPPTYAELSKSGAGIHLHYWYDGDVTKISRMYADSIEIKVYTGNSSLRRQLTKCNNLPIATISSGLPLKQEKKKEKFDMNDLTGVEYNKYIANLIRKNLKKEIHGATKPSVDFIYKILEDAYESGKAYNVESLKPVIIRFAAASTNQSDYCLSLIPKMHFKSDDAVDATNIISDDTDRKLAFLDIEIFPNVAFVNYKISKEKQMHRYINPTPAEVEKIVSSLRIVGHNVRKYDNHLLYAMMLGYSNKELFELSTSIVNRKEGFFADAYNLSYTDTLDYPSKKQSLKKWEIELGLHHLELGLPWDQPVPEELWDRVSKYCDNDVISTEAVFEATKDDFIARQGLVNIANALCPNIKSVVNDTTNTLTGRIIFRGDKNPQREFIYTDLTTGKRSDGTIDPLNFPGYRHYCVTKKATKLVDIVKNTLTTEDDVSNFRVISIYCHDLSVIEKYNLPDNNAWLNEELEALILDLIDKGLVDLLGEGGYVWAQPGMYAHVVTKDVRSMHPHEIKELNMFGSYTNNFFDLVTLRLHVKDRDWAAARTMLNGALGALIPEEGLSDEDADTLAYSLKIAINAVYGLTSAKFDNLFKDPRNVDNICAKRSALIMCQLRHIISDIAGNVIHIKTDSIKLVQPSAELLSYIDDYGAKYGLTFDIEAEYDRICLVNNAVYIAKYEQHMKKHGGEWTATGTQFAVPYVFKKCFSHEDIVFGDLCETKSVKSAMYLDMNEDIDRTEEPILLKVKKLRLKNTEDLKKSEVKLLSDYEFMSDEELETKLKSFHDYKFVGKVGLFCPIQKDHGGGELVRENMKPDGSVGMDAVVGTKGYRWLESEEVYEKNLMDYIDLDYYNTLVNNAIEDISKFGDYERFVSGDELEAWDPKKTCHKVNSVELEVLDSDVPF